MILKNILDEDFVKIISWLLIPFQCWRAVNGEVINSNTYTNSKFKENTI